VPSLGVAIELTVNDAHRLEVRLRSSEQPGVVATATAAIPAGLEAAIRGNAAPTDLVAFEQDGDIERGLLGVATGNWGRGTERTLQLFSFYSSTITARGVL
jgi:hypothetical protein